MAETKSGRRNAIVVLAGLAVVGGLLWAAQRSGEHSAKRDDLAVRLAQLDGDETCNMAWLKASDAGISGGRTPSIYAPSVKVVGPPRVISCPMIREGGVDADPMLVIKRCNDLDFDCVEIVRD